MLGGSVCSTAAKLNRLLMRHCVVSLTEKGAFGEGLTVTGTVTLSVQPAGVETVSLTL